MRWWREEWEEVEGGRARYLYHTVTDAPGTVERNDGAPTAAECTRLSPLSDHVGAETYTATPHYTTNTGSRGLGERCGCVTGLRLVDARNRSTKHSTEGDSPQPFNATTIDVTR